jgi:hypothetical protein
LVISLAAKRTAGGASGTIATSAFAAVTSAVVSPEQMNVNHEIHEMHEKKRMAARWNLGALELQAIAGFLSSWTR